MHTVHIPYVHVYIYTYFDIYIYTFPFPFPHPSHPSPSPSHPIQTREILPFALFLLPGSAFPTSPDWLGFRLHRTVSERGGEEGLPCDTVNYRQRTINHKPSIHYHTLNTTIFKSHLTSQLPSPSHATVPVLLPSPALLHLQAPCHPHSSHAPLLPPGTGKRA